jgi:hypothetical protein
MLVCDNGVSMCRIIETGVPQKCEPSLTIFSKFSVSATVMSNWAEKKGRFVKSGLFYFLYLSSGT